MTGPLSFSINEEQEALVEVARGFGERRLAPYYKQREQEGAFDRATLRAMGDLGLFGVEDMAASGSTARQRVSSSTPSAAPTTTSAS